MCCQTLIEEQEKRISDSEELFENADSEAIASYEKIKAEWSVTKINVLSEETKYRTLMEDLLGFIEKEKDIWEWIRTAEEVVVSVENIEQCENVEQLFDQFEVCFIYRLHFVINEQYDRCVIH